MDALSQLSVVLLFLAEVVVFTYFEYKAWRTIYTPLCCLMLPYTIVLLTTVAIAGDFGFVEFNYQSIWVWIYGLPFFALPSYALSAFQKYCGKPVFGEIEEDERGISKSLLVFSAVLVLLLFFRLYQKLSSSFFFFGTDDFAYEFSGSGIWAHLREMMTPALIMLLYYVRKGQYWIWALIFCMFIIQLTYMVKGYILITIVSAMAMRLYSQKSHMNVSLILKIVISAVLVFFSVYMLLPILGSNTDLANERQAGFVTEHIIHYFTSGTLGWSYDIDQGIPDRGTMEVIFSPFVNIIHVFTGEELVSPINPFYWYTGITLTNVRTFFGTLYIYTDTLQFVTYSIMCSTIIYALRLFALHTKSIYVYTVHFYYCGLLAMGWFEFYFFHLDVIELPFATGLIYLLNKTTHKKDEAVEPT